MTALERLLRAEVVGLLAVVVCAFVMGIYGFLEGWLRPSAESKPPVEAALFFFGWFLVVGFIVNLLYLAPVYAVLTHTGTAFWWTVMLAGGVPGVALMAMDTSGGAGPVVWGVALACFMHALSLRAASEKPLV